MKLVLKGFFSVIPYVYCAEGNETIEKMPRIMVAQI